MGFFDSIEDMRRKTRREEAQAKKIISRDIKIHQAP